MDNGMVGKSVVVLATATSHVVSVMDGFKRTERIPCPGLDAAMTTAMRKCKEHCCATFTVTSVYTVFEDGHILT